MSTAKNYVLGRGKLFFDPYDANGARTGERYLGNTTAFDLTVASNKLDHYDTDQGVKTKDDSALLDLTRSGSITADDISSANAALFVVGDESTYTQDGTAVTGESLGNAIPDRYYQLGVTTANPQGVRNVTSVTVNVDPSGTPTVAVLNTDYTLDAALGRIYIMPTSTLIDGTKEVQVDYTPDTSKRDRVTSASLTQLDGALRFISYNAKGEQKDFYFPYVTLTPTGNWGLKGDQWQQMQFNIEVNEPSDGSAAVYIDGRPQ